MERNARKKCAEAIMEMIPRMMNALGARMRGRADDALSVQQFHALRFLRLNTGASLSQVSEANGMTLPTASKMIDALVERGLVSRETDTSDRRKITLSLTPKGRRILEDIKSEAIRHLTEMLTSLDSMECAKVSEAMERLGEALVFDTAKN